MTDLNQILDDLLALFHKHNISFDTNRLPVLQFDAAGTAVSVGSLTQTADWTWSAVPGQPMSPPSPDPSKTP